MRAILLAFLLCSLYSCVPPGYRSDVKIDIDYSEEEHRDVRSLQDQRAVSELLPFLEDTDATIRYLAANALGSVQDSAATQSLLDILRTDESSEIRYQAAYALGQLKQPSSEGMLIESFQVQDTTIINTPLRASILEAVGKCGTLKSLNLLSSVSTYRDEDNWLLLGQARAIYRFGLRGIHSDLGTEKMVSFVLNDKISDDVRQIAANYLNEIEDLDLSNFIFQLLNKFISEDNPQIRMELAGALAKTGNLSILQALLDEALTYSDYRIGVEVISSLNSYPFETVRDSLVGLLNDRNHHIALAVSQLFKISAQAEDVRVMLSLAREDRAHDIKANLYAASLSACPLNFINTRTIIRNEINDQLQEDLTAFEITNYLSALAEDPINYGVIIPFAYDSTNQLIPSGALWALEALLGHNKFELVYASNRSKNVVINEVTEVILDILDSKNPGAIAIACSILRNGKFTGDDLVLLKLNLRQALRGLLIPAQIETKYEIERTLAYFDNQEYTPSPPVYNHPVDWEVLNALTDSSRAYFLTEKGQFICMLYFDEAPGSTSNFVKLAKSGFYNGNKIHRVVSNFVIQAGCHRGDGFGSEDYTIRSELGPLYYDDQGYIGMASAGKDTESNQWFITMAPTPHLDGRYSIFGKVISGMDVVHQLERGDEIREVRISIN